MISRKTQKEVYVSVDIEADGPIPGPYSMLSIGAALFNDSGEIGETFSVNLYPLAGASQDPKTMQWWDRNPDAWDACQVDRIDPSEAMTSFNQWVLHWSKVHGGKPVFVGYPASYDFMFVYWYLMYFVGSSPFSYSALDMKTMAMMLLKKPYRESTKRNMPKRWFRGCCKHSHLALDDAKSQGQLFINMRKEII